MTHQTPRLVASDPLPASGRWEVTVRCQGGGRTAEEASDLLQAFAAAAARGGFAGGVDRPAGSTLVQSDAGAEGLRRVWEVRGVDPRALRVLCNGLYAAAKMGGGRISAEVRGGDGPLKPLPAPGAEPAAGYYPERCPRLGFALAEEPPLAPRQPRRLLVEFARPVDCAAEAGVLAAVEAWAPLALAGYPASEEDLRSGACAIYNLETALFDEFTVETVVDDFGGVEAAWIPLLHLLAGLSSVAGGVRLVTIG